MKVKAEAEVREVKNIDRSQSQSWGRSRSKKQVSKLRQKQLETKIEEETHTKAEPDVKEKYSQKPRLEQRKKSNPKLREMSSPKLRQKRRAKQRQKRRQKYRQKPRSWTSSSTLPNSSTPEGCYRHPRVSTFLISDWSIYGLLAECSLVQVIWSNQILSIVPVIFIFHPGVPTLIVYLTFSLPTSDWIVWWLNMLRSNEIICIVLVVSILKNKIF